MSDLKTQKTGASVRQYLDAIPDEGRRRDAKAVARIMRRATGKRPRMWGASIVGYGSYQYVYASGREGDWLAAGFSSRKQTLTLYIISGFKEHDALMQRLGKHSTGKSCLYIKKLDDIDLEVLEELVTRSVAHVEAQYS